MLHGQDRDTSRNGRGGIRHEWGAWCNVRGAGLGQRPVATPMPGLDAYVWIKPPGESDGLCGGEHTYFFSPTQARRLIADSPWVPPSYRRLAARLPA